jgi:hypothetical protein
MNTFSLLLAALVAHAAKASIYFLNYSASDYTYTERFMFPTDQGPLYGKGSSHIELDMLATLPLNEMQDSVELVLAFYHIDEERLTEQTTLPFICSHNDRAVAKLFSEQGMENLERHFFELNAASVPIKAKYIVKERGLQYVRVAVCPSSLFDVVNLQGNMTFRNPYGYLPGVMYGFLPFQTMLTGCYILLDLLFIAALMYHREVAIPLQYGILAVLMIGTVESSSWQYAYNDMNISGEPSCCPFPKVLVAAVLLEMVRKTLSRILLLVVCLGLGMVRPTLEKREVCSITVLAILYLVFGISGRVQQSTITNEEYEAEKQPEPMYALVELVCNLVFVVWIYAALGNIQKVLEKDHETAKLKMYQKLSFIIGCFIIVFLMMTIITVAIRLGFFVWPWDFLWVLMGLSFSDDGCFWRLLNFAILCTMCILWRPSPGASQYALSMQLPSSSEEADDMDSGIELEPVDFGPS